MTIAPEPELRACLRILYIASIETRAAAWQNNIHPERLADLMDAIHNIPSMILHWDSCDQNMLQSKLLEYEKKWRADGPCIRTIYEQELLKRID